MNFFGHAILAARDHDAPAFLLGSMLPDFISMVRGKPELEDGSLLAQGVAHHHAVDHAFHGAPLFLELMGDGQDRLDELGVRPGPAMAAAHVGVELLLDGWLADRGHDPERFERALEAHVGNLRWPSEALEQRWELLRHRLLDGTLPGAYLDPEFVATRIDWVLSPRPRLALVDPERAAVSTWLTTARTLVASSAEALMRQVWDRHVARRERASSGG